MTLDDKIKAFLSVNYGSGDGEGYGYGSGYGSGDGYGDGSGDGYGDCKVVSIVSDRGQEEQLRMK